MASTSASSNRVLRSTQSSSRRRSQYGVKVQFRIDGSVYRVLRKAVPNLSEYMRKLVYDAARKLPSYIENEEIRLEVEVAQLVEELHRFHSYSKALLKHGSYAQAYLQSLKGGRVIDTKPYYQRDVPPEVSKIELKTVESVVEYRELLAEKKKKLAEEEQNEGTNGKQANEPSSTP
jgi:hypothetical protein